jgi:hypothetical protein
VSEPIETWSKVKNDEVSYETVDAGLSDSIYITDEYVFKSGSDSNIWKNMKLNEEVEK